MILGSAPSWQPDDWQDSLKKLITTPKSLAPHIAISLAQQQSIAEAAQTFPLRIPESYLQRLPLKNLDSPVLKQFIPSLDELTPANGFSADPVQEIHKNHVPGLIHKYHGRVLLLVSSSCPIHCRYCFRRHFPYGDNRNNREDWQQALDYIRADKSLSEVIFSGGDPLSAQDTQLAWLIEQLANIPHLKRLRIHTRYPVVIPERVTPSLLKTLESRLQTSVVIHCNHPDELNANTHAALQAIQAIQKARIILLNQSVLLKGINDDAQVLIDLSEKLYSQGVLPYYLHQLDRVEGAAHFEVAEPEALKLHKHLQAQLPGYLVPKLVREEPHQPNKTLLR